MAMFLRRLGVIVATAMALVLIAAACGGSSEKTATSVPATKAPQATSTAPASTVAPTPTPAPTNTPAPTATPTPPAPKRGGILQTRLLSVFPSLDTYDQRGSYSFIHVANALNSLIYLDLKTPGKIDGDLASDWSLSADGKTYTFKLRQGVQWHDGHAFTSADVLYNLNAAWKPSSTLRSWNVQFMRRVVDIKAPDDFTVAVTLDRPSASFLPGLGTPHMLMLPAHVQDISVWEKTLLGTGPFKLKSLSRDTTVEYARNDNYWKKDAAGRAMPYLDGVVYNIIPAADVALASFRAGRIDCGCGFDTDFMTPNRALIKQQLPDVQLTNFWSNGYVYFKQEAPYTDQRVRQALSIAMDRRTFAAALQDGFSYFPESPFFAPGVGGQWGLSSDEMLQLPGWRADHAADLAMAKKLLADAGVDPASLNPVFIGPQQFQTDMTLIDAGLRELGIKSKLTIFQTGADITAARRAGNYNLSYETPAPAFDDPNQYGARLVITNDPTNYAKWSDPEIDKGTQDIDLELDPAKRLVIAKAIQRRLIDWGPLMSLPYTGRTQGVRGYVKGYAHISPIPIDLSGRLEAVWLDK